jgi:hypothetical protein
MVDDNSALYGKRLGFPPHGRRRQVLYFDRVRVSPRAGLNEQGLAVFELLRRGDRIKKAAHLFAFDLFEFNGCDLKRAPLKSARAVWPIS